MTTDDLEIAEAIRFGETLVFDAWFLRACGIAPWTAEGAPEGVDNVGE